MRAPESVEIAVNEKQPLRQATSSMLECVLDFHQERGLVRHALADHNACDQVLSGADYAGTGLNDAGLLRRDFLDRMTQIVFVVEINLRDHGDVR